MLLLRNERDEWELPGGKLELGKDPVACVAREIAEEADWGRHHGPDPGRWNTSVTAPTFSPSPTAVIRPAPELNSISHTARSWIGEIPPQLPRTIEPTAAPYVAITPRIGGLTVAAWVMRLHGKDARLSAWAGPKPLLCCGAAKELGGYLRQHRSGSGRGTGRSGCNALLQVASEHLVGCSERCRIATIRRCCGDKPLPQAPRQQLTINDLGRYVVAPLAASRPGCRHTVQAAGSLKTPSQEMTTTPITHPSRRHSKPVAWKNPRPQRSRAVVRATNIGRPGGPWVRYS